mmetsp:Transcript_89620/g.254031  ORF Transcript_89620/g.254031 Transcript_89620/m.254031 type:complete len:333 (+) Transcript_89620:1-999(+)
MGSGPGPQLGPAAAAGPRPDGQSTGRKAKQLHLAITLAERRQKGWRHRRLRRQARAKRLRARDPAAGCKRQLEELPAEPSLAPVLPSKCRKAFPASEDGEASRHDVGLKLIKEIAPRGTSWEYPVENDQWCCYAGYLPKALETPVADRLFDIVKKGTPWTQPSGRWGPLPLRTAWMTQSPCTCRYGYGGAEVAPAHYPEWMKEVMEACMPLCGLTKPSQWPNSCNLNMYVDGQHSVGWHADNESLFQGRVQDCCIISLSLGQTRLFELKYRKDQHSLSLGNGDLCTMEGLTQKYYQHRVGKDHRRSVGPRINLTWRWVVQHNPGCTLAQAAR